VLRKLLFAPFPYSRLFRGRPIAQDAALLRSVATGASRHDGRRKRTLWICAAILAAPKLAEFKDGEKDALEVEIVRDAVRKAERIIGHIDYRWPVGRVAV
jgi:hypothetical protein